jgi:hypothetical protein
MRLIFGRPPWHLPHRQNAIKHGQKIDDPNAPAFCLEGRLENRCAIENRSGRTTRAAARGVSPIDRSARHKLVLKQCVVRCNNALSGRAPPRMRTRTAGRVNRLANPRARKFVRSVE